MFALSVRCKDLKTGLQEQLLQAAGIALYSDHFLPDRPHASSLHLAVCFSKDKGFLTAKAVAYSFQL